MSNYYESGVDDIVKYTQPFDSCPDKLLGVPAINPLIGSTSGSRGTLMSVEERHLMCPERGEHPYISGGYENQFAEMCSSSVDADEDMEVLDIVPKFSHAPQHHYFLIVKRLDTGEIDVIERKSYTWTSEEYGYIEDTRYLDQLNPGYTIKKGDPIKRSNCYDDDGNRANVINMLTLYAAMDETNEDAMIISDEAAEKGAVPLYDKIQIILNTNDIPTNLYGTENTFKSFPWVGETTSDGIVMSVRRDVRDESLRTQTRAAMKRKLMSDVTYSSDCDEVIDFDIYCNNPEELAKKGANVQILEAYNRRLAFVKDFVTKVTNVVNSVPNTGMTYKLSKMYATCTKEQNGNAVDRDGSNKEFKGTILQFVLKHRHTLKKGDKVANRFGGKGVISNIVPKELMPMDEFGVHIHCIVNQGTSGNRLNPSQNKELSLNMCSRQIVRYIAAHWDPSKSDICPRTDQADKLSTIEAFDMVLTYIRIVSIPMYNYWYDWYTDQLLNNPEYMEFVLQYLIDEDVIAMSLGPLSETIDLDTLSKIYNTFECCHQMRCSFMKWNSKRNKLIKFPMFGLRSVGHISYIILKQYAKEKYSVVCLANTNLRNTNTRSKSNKFNTTPFRDTPIMFGNMESGDFAHATIEEVVNLLMVYSVSPQARMQVEQMYTRDPYDIDIRITPDSTNRSVEIIDDYFKQLGFRIVFGKRKKELDLDTAYFEFDAGFSFRYKKTTEAFEFRHKAEQNAQMSTDAFDFVF